MIGLLILFKNKYCLRSRVMRCRALVAMMVVAALGFLLSPSRDLHAKLIIDVNNPNQARMPIAVTDFVSEQAGSLSGKDMAQIIKTDLQLTGLFQMVEPGRPIAPTSQQQPDFAGWLNAGAQALVFGTFQVSGDQLVFEGRLYDVILRKLDSGKRFTANLRDHRKVIHLFADRILEQLTGIPGAFSTRIAFVGAKKPAQIFSMDFDGHHLTQVTRNNTINLSPDWSPDGRSMLFTSYLNGKPDLWSLDLSTMQPRVVSDRPGLNASARYSPDGKIVALSINHQGIPKIFLITPQGNILKRLTDGRGNDISPTWSPDLSKIAYVSDQAGTPQIYVVPIDGGQVRRLTFQSNYNTDPGWSPREDLLAFTARVNGRFQICTIRADGTGYRVLTQEGSNQAPAWSPDGRMIAFSSDREGSPRVYVMDAGGQFQFPVSPIPGKAPAWSRQTR